MNGFENFNYKGVRKKILILPHRILLKYELFLGEPAGYFQNKGNVSVKCFNRTWGFLQPPELFQRTWVQNIQVFEPLKGNVTLLMKKKNMISWCFVMMIENATFDVILKYSASVYLGYQFMTGMSMEWIYLKSCFHVPSCLLDRDIVILGDSGSFRRKTFHCRMSISTQVGFHWHLLAFQGAEFIQIIMQSHSLSAYVTKIYRSRKIQCRFL